MTKAQADFITEVAESARITHGDTGIPASITIAQAILESGWGKTRLASDYYNYFGIKATPGETYIEFPTREYLAGVKTVVQGRFAWYKSPLDCFRVHAWLLSHCSRYEPAMKLTHSASAFAHALQECGYSTNPTYADQLMDLVDEFSLCNFDMQPAPNDPAKAA